jgi:hypothetical protein
MIKKKVDLDLENLPDELDVLYSFVVNDILENYVLYYHHGNKSAGARLRKNSLTLKKFAENLRKQIREDLKSED